MMPLLYYNKYQSYLKYFKNKLVNKTHLYCHDSGYLCIILYSREYKQFFLLLSSFSSFVQILKDYVKAIILLFDVVQVKFSDSLLSGIVFKTLECSVIE